MARRIELVLKQKKVRAVATFLEEAAPRTCNALWDMLPIDSDTYHAKWAGRELYTLVPPSQTSPGMENATIMPIPGDLLWFDVHPDSIDIPVEMRKANPHGFVDIAVFYGRNSFLLSPHGFMPGNLFATITEGFDDYAKACGQLFREGVVHERFMVRRL